MLAGIALQDGFSRLSDPRDRNGWLLTLLAIILAFLLALPRSGAPMGRALANSDDVGVSAFELETLQGGDPPQLSAIAMTAAACGSVDPVAEWSSPDFRPLFHAMRVAGPCHLRGPPSAVFQG